MSKLEVDAIEPQSGTTLTIGASGDTITIASGATLTGDLNATNLTSGTVSSARITGAYTGITQTGTLSSFASTGIDDNATSTAITIDSSENVGIGTTSPVSLGANITTLEITGRSTIRQGGVYLSNSDKSHKSYIYGSNTAANLGTGTNIPLVLLTNNTEKMRITSAGRLLIAKTSEATNTVGIELKETGLGIFTSDADNSLIVNRKTSDGSILQFRKDNTTVGSIGSRSSVVTTIILDPRTATNGGAGIGATGATAQPAILPTDESTVADNNTDLGSTAARWRDLFLSGGAYIGGTGTANKLDDYEEGTWTPTYVPASGAFTSVTYASTSGNYTKIGNTVYFTFYIQTNAITVGSASGVIAIGGLPFAPSATGVPKGGGTVTNAANFAGDKPSYGTASVSSQINLFYSTGSTSNDISLNVSDLGTGGTDNVFQMFGTYLTTA
jgi:hypothetical protein